MTENSYFGSARFTFDWDEAELKKLWGLYAGALVGSIVLFSLGMVMMGALFTGLFGKMGIVLALAGTLTACGWLWIVYIAERRRFVWNHTKFGNAQFTSTIEGGELGRLYGVNALLAVVSLGLALPWIRVRSVRYNLEHLKLQGSVNLTGVVQDAQNAAPTGEELAGFFDVDALAS